MSAKQESKENKEVARVISGAVVEAFSEFQDEVVIDSSDLEIPRIKLMQGSSDLVKEQMVASVGEYRDNLGNLLASREDQLEIIVFKRDKAWEINEIDEEDQRVEGSYRREVITPENIGADEEFTQDGKRFTRGVVWDYFVILANDKGEEVFTKSPYVMSFSSSGLKAARRLNTVFSNLAKAKKLPIEHVIKLGRSSEKSKKGHSYLVATVEIGRPTTKFEVEYAAMCRQDFSDKKVKFDEVGDEA